MKTITLDLKEFMTLKELANKNKYNFQVQYNKKKENVCVTISEKFLDIFGFNT